MCQEKVDVPVLMSDGTYKIRRIDKCISGLIRELNSHGIKTVSLSCCGHGTEDGYLYIEPKFVDIMKFGVGIKIPKKEV